MKRIKFEISIIKQLYKKNSQYFVSYLNSIIYGEDLNSQNQTTIPPIESENIYIKVIMVRKITENCMRVPISDIANASRKTPSFRSRSPSIRPVFKDMRNYELDVQHIVHGLLKRAREERDDPKFAGRQKSRAEECPDLLTATSIESELQSEVSSICCINSKFTNIKFVYKRNIH